MRELVPLSSGAAWLPTFHGICQNFSSFFFFLLMMKPHTKPPPPPPTPPPPPPERRMFPGGDSAENLAANVKLQFEQPSLTLLTEGAKTLLQSPPPFLPSPPPAKGILATATPHPSPLASAAKLPSSITLFANQMAVASFHRHGDGDSKPQDSTDIPPPDPQLKRRNRLCLFISRDGLGER